jgi:hypothetical protein
MLVASVTHSTSDDFCVSLRSKVDVRATPMLWAWYRQPTLHRRRLRHRSILHHLAGFGPSLAAVVTLNILRHQSLLFFARSHSQFTLVAAFCCLLLSIIVVFLIIKSNKSSSSSSLSASEIDDGNSTVLQYFFAIKLDNIHMFVFVLVF